MVRRRMPVRLGSAILCSLAVGITANISHAQQGSLFPGGTGAAGSPVGGTGAAGGLGAAGAGGTALGTSAFAGQLQGQGATGQGAFIGQNIQGGFVGNAAAAQGGNAGQPANFGGFNTGGNRGGGNVNQGNQQIRSPIRPRQVIAFDYPQPTRPIVVANAQRSLRTLDASRPELRQVNVVVGSEGRTVVRGNVSSERERKLALALVRLEPGVRKVVDEITVREDTNR